MTVVKEGIAWAREENSRFLHEANKIFLASQEEFSEVFTERLNSKNIQLDSKSYLTALDFCMDSFILGGRFAELRAEQDLDEQTDDVFDEPSIELYS